MATQEEITVNSLPENDSPTTDDQIMAIKNADGSLTLVTLATLQALIGGGVESVNGQTGAVTITKSNIGLGNVDNVQQYSASNPPPYPVTSVNGQTGAVSLSIPSSASDVGAVAVSQGVAHAGEFVVVGSDGNITTVTMIAWAGGSY